MIRNEDCKSEGEMGNLSLHIQVCICSWHEFWPNRQNCPNHEHVPLVYKWISPLRRHCPGWFPVPKLRKMGGGHEWHHHDRVGSKRTSKFEFLLKKLRQNEVKSTLLSVNVNFDELLLFRHFCLFWPLFKNSRACRLKISIMFAKHNTLDRSK